MLITRGFTSSYSVWSAMEKESKKNKNLKKVLAYVNIHKRTINLSKLGFLEEIKSDLINMHSRRDYKVTLKGLEQLLPYFLVNPDEIENIVQYMNKFKLDKKAFGNMLSNRFMSMIKSLNLYIGSTTYLEPLPVDAIQIDQLQKTTIEFNTRLEMIQQNIDVFLDKLYEQLRHHLETNNIMSTLDYNGQLRLSYKHPHTPKEIAKLTRQNIEKMKRIRPRTVETIIGLEGYIKSSTNIVKWNAPFKTKSKAEPSKSLSTSIKSYIL